MKKIEQYLQKASIVTKKSMTTISKYYFIKHLEIRYSDHINLFSNSDLQIIVSTCSNCDYYTIIYKNYSKIMILNAK